MWDERLTSREAHEILYASGKSRQEHKPLVDQVAASLILQSFMDAHRDRTPPASDTAQISAQGTHFEPDESSET